MIGFTIIIAAIILIILVVVVIAVIAISAVAIITIIGISYVVVENKQIVPIVTVGFLIGLIVSLFDAGILNCKADFSRSNLLFAKKI